MSKNAAIPALPMAIFLLWNTFDSRCVLGSMEKKLSLFCNNNIFEKDCQIATEANVNPSD